MKITIDKKMTYVDELPTVKERVKAFKSKYEDWELLKVFADSMKDSSQYALQLALFTNTIISCELSAFPAINENHYFVEMIVRNISGFYEITFFVSDDLTISTGEMLRTIVKYEKANRQTA